MQASYPVEFKYTNIVTRDIIARSGSYNPRHVMGYILLGNHDLSEMTDEEIDQEVVIAKGCIDEGGSERAERNAQTYDL